MIPVAVITGFLGSGKTTLLARLLRDPGFARTAVIMNEFGEIGLDHELIETSDESFVQLSNGCICCRVRSDLVQTLLDLSARLTAGTVPRFERVVVETTGLADPAPILHALMAERDLSGLYVLDNVITTVDAVTGLATLDKQEESLRQAALADRIVVTKTDLAQSQTDRVLERLAGVNPQAAVLTAVRGEIAASTLFGADAPASMTGASAHEVARMNAPLDHTHERHRDDIRSFCIVRDEPIDAAALALFISALAENCGADLLRVKGIVHVTERPEAPAVIHGVQHVYHAPEWLARWPSPERRSRMVFIGRGVSKSWVRNLLELLQWEVREQIAQS